MPIKMVVVVRTDLDMGRGKLAAQVAHAAVTAALDSAGTAVGAQWLEDGQPKVVVRADDEAHLVTVVEAAVSARLPVATVRDAGRTQLPAGTLTCAALGPADDRAVDAVTGDLRLL